jgi:hypothetical protein
MSVDAEKKEALLGMRQDFDAATMHQLLRSLLPPGTPFDPAKVPKAEMYDSAEYLIDTTANWIKRVKHVRCINAGASLQRKDTTEITIR